MSETSEEKGTIGVTCFLYFCFYEINKTGPIYSERKTYQRSEKL
jgi:hypothetical protein